MATSNNLHSFTDDNFDAELLKSPLPVLVDFTAVWCGPCKLLSPIVEKLADELAGKVRVGKLDIDNNQRVTSQYGIRGVPTVMVFKGGQRTAQHVGLTDRKTLLKLLEET
jgi:thioredoxin 1